jgi:hypothetical protein
VLPFRLNRQYRSEAGAVEALTAGKPPDPPNFTRRTVLVLVDDFDLAAIAALRYARSLRPTALRAVHFVTDQQRADHMLQQWVQADRGIPLDLVDCPHRRIERAAAELAATQARQPGTYLTVLLPRRSTRPLLGRLLHDRTADKIAAWLVWWPSRGRRAAADARGTPGPAEARSCLTSHALYAGAPGRALARGGMIVVVDGRTDLSVPFAMMRSAGPQPCGRSRAKGAGHERHRRSSRPCGWPPRLRLHFRPLAGP